MNREEGRRKTMVRKHREDFHDDFSYEMYVDELFESSYKCGYDLGKKHGRAEGRLDSQIFVAEQRKEIAKEGEKP